MNIKFNDSFNSTNEYKIQRCVQRLKAIRTNRMSVANKTIMSTT